MKKTLLLILKLCVSTGLLAVIFSKIPLPAIAAILRQTDISAFIGAVLCYLCACYIASIRWNLLVSHDMRASRLFTYYMIGAFFNTCLPGLVGGDAVKAWYLTQDLKAQASANPDQALTDPPITIAVASVFMDRLMGLGALLTLGMLAYPFGTAYLAGTNSTWLLPLIFAIYLLLLFLLFLLPSKNPFRRLTSFAVYVSRYRTNSSVLLAAFGYSLMIQILGFFSIVILARGLGIEINLLAIMVFLPIIVVFTLLPVSISGLGIREGAFVFFFGTVGVEAEKAIALSLLWFFSLVLAGLWGLVAYLRIRKSFGPEEKKNSL